MKKQETIEMVSILDFELQWLKDRAAKIDKIEAKMEELYSEDSEADLTDIGEEMSILLGYL